MKRQYLIRLDDACPTMDHAKWQRMEDILDKYEVKPMVGVIPHNEDDEQKIDDLDPSFWQKVKSWEEKGWAIALHGYNHCYASDGGLKGLNPLWRRSEFAGLPLEKQRKKIKNGMTIMKENGVAPKYFFAPSHTFDENTLMALKEESNIRIISDTIATKPYCYKDFIIIPQLGGHCSEMCYPGVWTFCLHPNVMSDDNFNQTEDFIKRHRDEFTTFDVLDFTKIGKKGIVSRLLSCVYFTYRRIRGLR